MPPLPRRDFLRLAALAGATINAASMTHAVEPFNRPGAASLRLALAAYSFRDDFNRTGPDNQPRMDMFRFVDYCAEQGCRGAELTSYYFPVDVTDDYLARVRRHAHLRGITVTGTAVGNDFCHPPGSERDKQIALVRDWIARAAIMGAPHIRVFAGDARGQPLGDAKKRCIEALEECGELAGRHGIVLGLENHGGIVAEADDLLDIVRTVKSPWVGINLDTGNFHTDDPYADLAKCAPWAVNVQFKGRISRRGQKAEPADFSRTFQLLREAKYQGWVVLEYEFEEDPWVLVPRLLSRMREQIG